MKIVFMGTPDFAAASLGRLYADGRDVAAVFTQPDRPKNRGMKLAPSPVAVLAQGKSDIWKPASLRDGEAEHALRALSPDVIVVVAYGRLLPPEVLGTARLGCVNIHASLLPKYRGAAPIQRAVLAGEKTTGVVSMYMAEELDAGNIILSKTTEIGEYETSGELFARLAPLGAELLSETLDALACGDAAGTPQDHTLATYAPPLMRNESPVDWTRSAREVINQIRGLDPWPAATAQFNGIVYKLYSPRLAETGGHSAPPGTVLEGEGLIIACGEGVVQILELQAPGKKRVRAGDYLRGNKITGQAVPVSERIR